MTGSPACPLGLSEFNRLSAGSAGLSQSVSEAQGPSPRTDDRPPWSCVERDLNRVLKSTDMHFEHMEFGFDNCMFSTCTSAKNFLEGPASYGPLSLRLPSPRTSHLLLNARAGAVRP